MRSRYLHSVGGQEAVSVGAAPENRVSGSWVWADIQITDKLDDQLIASAKSLGLDPLAFRGAIEGATLSKVDDLDDQLHIVLHGLREGEVATYDLHCFIKAGLLVTVAEHASPAVDALWSHIQQSSQLSHGGVDELVARLADALTRRLLSVLSAFDDRIDDLVGMALAADGELLEELTAVRADLSATRRVVHPQREALDLLRNSSSPLITEVGRRRFSDVFDVASRTASGIDAARAALAETLDAYRGAEARQATDVMKVLTIYTAVMLPLTLVVGFFGMNFSNLPLIESRRGWVLAFAVMIVMMATSIWLFVAAGWIRRPRSATVKRGLSATARSPVHIATTAFETAVGPISALRRRKTPEAKPEDGSQQA